jgi:hypothetical protein
MNDKTPRGHSTRTAMRMRPLSGRRPHENQAGPDADAVRWPAWTRTPITRAFTLLDPDGQPIRGKGVA